MSIRWRHDLPWFDNAKAHALALLVDMPGGMNLVHNDTIADPFTMTKDGYELHTWNGHKGQSAWHAVVTIAPDAHPVDVIRDMSALHGAGNRSALLIGQWVTRRGETAQGLLVSIDRDENTASVLWAPGDTELVPMGQLEALP